MLERNNITIPLVPLLKRSKGILWYKTTGLKLVFGRVEKNIGGFSRYGSPGKLIHGIHGSEHVLQTAKWLNANLNCVESGIWICISYPCVTKI